VDVRVLVPHEADVAIVGPACRSYYPYLVPAGVRVFEYRKSILHAKSLVIDGAWGVVGSANADIRSFRLNFELGALVVDPQFARHLEEGFFRDLAHSDEVVTADLERRSVPTRLWEGTCRLLSPLL
jgi:cardiolipin synthase